MRVVESMITICCQSECTVWTIYELDDTGNGSSVIL